MSTVIRLELASPNISKPAKSAEIILYDDIGPLNSWEPIDKTSFTVNGKQLMVWEKANSTINCRGGGLAPILILKNFDLDNPQVDQKGEGENNDSGDCQWKIIEVN